MLHEPAVALTDYLLAVECGVFAALLARRGADAAWTVVFAATSAASLLGGTVHGFFPPDAEGPAIRTLWVITMLCVGVIAAALVRAGAGVGWGRERARRLNPGLGMALIGYGGVVVFVSREFVVAIAAYLPAALFMMFVFARNGWRGRPAGVVPALSGIAMTIVGAAAQSASIGLHPVYFDHNALYHVVQAVALYLLFRAALVVGETS
ncbi:MAG: hypothetical protein IH849_06830 [Acidobacteria bacterium]|nr:hypothetical protein [Acidobacteriota bacterium]